MQVSYRSKSVWKYSYDLGL